ncbi:hypothetical protein APUTEX25_001154, partial [Auxenochlorella protothecoides]
YFTHLIVGKTADHLAINATTRHQRAKGLSKAGSLRDTTLNTLGLAVDAINAGTLKVKTARSTKIIVAVECVKNGQKACTADKDGNIGTGNRGKDNYGGKNTGNNNIGKEAGWGGVLNKGNRNWGFNNTGTDVHCNNSKGTWMVSSSLQEVTASHQEVAASHQEVAASHQEVAASHQEVAASHKARLS